MKNERNNITKLIMSRIAQSKPGSLFFISDFADLNNDEMVGKILSQSEKLEKVIRLSNGIYFKPEYSRFGIIYPSTEKIVEAIAERDKAQILPTGSTAMNILGLSTQIPMNPVYITNGSARTINIGKRKITFRRSVPKNFAYKGEIMPLLVQALKSIGKENVTEQNMQAIRSLLQEHSEPETILHDLQLAPLWIKKLLLPIIKTKINIS
ncbi:DUF6088 family protein [Parabacteroides sp. ASD2025]|uniref:DUF6088 family protein n=1 Tax=Parabacteroides sp. ASD2025 TaxID=3415987 RepID=UPI0025F2AFBE|nr:DUF6088 family protein [uncultured Parabacteroides sp.]